MTETARYDELWKEALDLYFEPILAFFFPAEHAFEDEGDDGGSGRSQAVEMDLDAATV